MSILSRKSKPANPTYTRRTRIETLTEPSAESASFAMSPRARAPVEVLKHTLFNTLRGLTLAPADGRVRRLLGEDAPDEACSPKSPAPNAPAEDWARARYGSAGGSIAALKDRISRWSFIQQEISSRKQKEVLLAILQTCCHWRLQQFVIAGYVKKAISGSSR